MNYLASPLRCLYRHVSINMPQIKPISLFPLYSHNSPSISIKLNDETHRHINAKNLRILFRHSTLLSCIHSVPMICQVCLRNADTTSAPAIGLSHLERGNSLFSISFCPPFLSLPLCPSRFSLHT